MNFFKVMATLTAFLLAMAQFCDALATVVEAVKPYL